MSGSDCDWFDKNEEELLKDVEKTVKKKRHSNTEYIKAPTSSIVDYIIDLSIKAAVQPKDDGKKKNKIKIETLRKFATLSPMELLLHIQTLGYDFYSEQIYLNDSQEKVILYTYALAEICRLELPGFRKDVLKTIAFDENLQQQYCLLLAKLMCTKYKNMWLNENEMLEFIKNMELLILKSFKVHRKVEKMNLLMKDLLSILQRTDNPVIAKKQLVISLKSKISQALRASESPEDNMEIFPTLEELHKEYVLTSGPDNIPSTSKQTGQEYLTKHLKILKEDFFFSLKHCFDLLKNKTNATEMPDNFFVFEDVLIVLNERFLDAYRHELVFVDILGTTRDLNTEEVVIPFPVHDSLKKIKTGSLLCFSTSYSFENLILATVSFTTLDCMKEGFIGIEIARQYNIGNIYSRKLIMFECPAFFEPYNNVFNYLKNCTISNFPLKNYFVNAQVPDKQIPKYLNEDTKYSCYGKEFKPLSENPPQDVFGLNDTQLLAFKTALTQVFCLIQGPPGTGKTYLSVQIVKTLIENADTPVVLVTYTNDSLDKFLVKMSQYTDKIVRFGSQSRDPLLAKYNVRDIVEHTQLHPKLKQLYYTVSTEFREKFQSLQQKHKDFDNTDESYQEILKAQQELAEVNEKILNIKIMFQYYVAKEQSIIAFTTTCAAKINFLFRLLKSKIVIFEEAAEIVESHVLACLSPYTQHVIMLGDHLQLQPNSSSYQLRQNSYTNISFFEKMFKMQKNPIQLNIQYRMHPKIADLFCKTIYKNLVSDVSVTQYPIVEKMMTNLFFMTHRMSEAKTQHDASVYNNFEIEEIIKLALHLVENAKYDTEDIHVLSPYSRQVEYMRKKFLKYRSLSMLKASTVDSFQGLECKIILLSLVRSNEISQIGFLKQPNRICVALSRAKHGLYIIGDLALLSQCSTTWSQIRDKLIALHALGTEFPITS